MNKGMLAIGIILLAIIALNLLNVLNNYATGSELDYYLLKETTDAAMADALDNTYLRIYYITIALKGVFSREHAVFLLFFLEVRPA